MANERWPVLAPDGSEVLPITDGIYYTAANMGSSSADNCHVYVEFFTDAAGTVLANPSAGTVSAQGSPMGEVWLASSTGQTINAADVKLIGSYTPFVFTGRMQQGRIGFSGITGALTARVTFWRY
jgi:hypothetical protein